MTLLENTLKKNIKKWFDFSDKHLDRHDAN